ncbi:hypothetical protein KTC96_22500 (plasmid) [Clostridium estertheticum]|uniref:hypothetical protein n=1 Tax=Clostridium estertheticum TaxID=238834 RepID=UPI001C7DF81D|nr:hypothetical protein [Clostridium estertheticum]MBX4260432.1 hypothetical protein [Clostridium estertheticum]WLC72989.1 hypothetical protein KTC96_22500 [Clostridium estertheticum]
MFDIILNDIKRYLRTKNKNTIQNGVFIVCLVGVLAVNMDKIYKHGEYVFLFVLYCILMQGIYGMVVLVTNIAELNDTRFLFTMPISMKTFISAKNSLLLAMMLSEFMIIEFIFIKCKIWNNINITKNLSFIAILIFCLAISNLYLYFSHKKFIAPIENDFNSILTYMKDGYLFFFISILVFILVFLS